MAVTDALIRGRTADPRADVQAESCAHCGLPVPAGLLDSGAALQFCCAGCRAVHDMLVAGGLERFYDLSRAAGSRPAPARPRDRSYAELDDPGFQSRSCSETTGGLRHTELYLEGIHCSACLWLVERLPRLVPGVVEIRLDLPRSRASVRWDPATTTLSAIARRLDALGYPPHPCRGRGAQEARRREDRAMLVRIGIAGAVAANVMGIAFALYGGMLHGMEPEFATFFRWASLVIAVPSLIWGAGVFFLGAWVALRTRTLHMDLPISVGLLAGFVHAAVATVTGASEPYLDSLTVLIFLLLAGRHLQRRQQRSAADATELIAALAPSAARLIEDGAIREVPLEALMPGAHVEVRAGDTIPADGVVVSGRSTLDLSLLSGESRPVGASPGDAVHAGTVNLSSRLEVRIRHTGEDTRLGRLMRLVEEHARRRAPIVQLADRLSGYFVGAVLALAAVTFALWVRLDAARAVDHAVALLIVTCPCALGLATPLALSAAIGHAARSGLLIKGADVLEKLARPGRMWLDKTGTLTEGRVALVGWWGEESARPLAAAVEAHSSHPIARALVSAVAEVGIRLDATATETPGGGVEGRVGSQDVLVGSIGFVGARVGEMSPPLASRLDMLTGEGLTPVLVAIDGSVVALAAFGDPLRPEAAGVVRRLSDLGWRLGILSGDHPRVVSAAGERLGLPARDCLGGMTPEAKLDLVASQAAHGTVIMVGDGVNDTAALAAATVGVGVSGGAEAALAAADVFVTRPGVAALVELLLGAQRAMRVVKRNLVFSLLYNVIGVVLAMAGLLNPLVAALLMPASSLTVVVSSYRARTFGPRRRRAWAPWA
jgi:Cu2+-exporting ATPase